MYLGKTILRQHREIRLQEFRARPAQALLNLIFEEKQSNYNHWDSTKKKKIKVNVHNAVFQNIFHSQSSPAIVGLT